MPSVVSDPFNHRLISALHLRVKEKIEIALAPAKVLTGLMKKHEDAFNLFENITTEQNDNRKIENITLKTISEDASPIVRTVNSILYQAYRENASDIHLESLPNGMLLRYRMDGILVEINRINGIETARQIISRLKVMAELDIAERRIPQDGRLMVAIQGHNINFRISVMPSIHGEDVVIRILDKQLFTGQLDVLNLEELGLDSESIRIFRLLAYKPYGMMLMTGPTGSGKTTTLYTIISEIFDGKDKIITIEDPVEYQLNGVLQIPVNEKKGLTFSRGLRSILRHDPDKLLIGEIRDNDTAEIAVQSALTGHAVFSTVHANSPFDVIGRFSYMNIDLFNFISALNGVVAQRLVRLICPHCKTQRVADKKTNFIDELTDKEYFFGQGCHKCRNTGYHGRRAVAETLVLNDEIREMIIRRNPIHQVKKYAIDNGMITIRDRIAEMVNIGDTSPEEFRRNTL